MEKSSRPEYESVDVELLEQPMGPEKIRQARDFYEKLRQKITDWATHKGGAKGRRAAEILLLAPDLFMLLLRLVQDRRTPLRQKALLGVGIAYFISPVDFMPEVILGPMGYLDDIVLAVYVINQVLNTDRQLVLENWSGRGDVLVIVQEVIAKAEDLVGKRVYRQLQKLFKQKSG